MIAADAEARRSRADARDRRSSRWPATTDAHRCRAPTPAARLRPLPQRGDGRRFGRRATTATSGEPIGGGDRRRIAGLGIVALLAWLGCRRTCGCSCSSSASLVSVFLHETGHFVTARLTGMKATQFFSASGPRCGASTAARPSTACAPAAARRVRADHRHEQPRRGRRRRTRRAPTAARRYPAADAGDHGRLDHAHPHRHRAAVRRVYARQGRARRDRPGRRRRRRCAGGAAGQRRHRARRHRRCRSTAQPVDAADELGDGRACVTSRATRSTSSSIRDGASRSLDVDARHQPDAGRPILGSALLGVTSRGSRPSGSRCRSARPHVDSVTDLWPIDVASVEGVVKVLNPVNIFDHLTGSNDDPATRPTTVVGVTQVSGDDRRRRRARRHAAACSPALNVFVGLFNMFPLLPLDGGHAAIATYERIRESRRRPALLRRRGQADARRDGRDRGARASCSCPAVPRHRQIR